MKTVAVGSGEALELGEKGDADVLLVHSPEAEQEYMDAGHGVSRKAVMHNDFIVVGPADDPAGIKGAGLGGRGVHAHRKGRSAVRVACRRVRHEHQGAVDLGGGRDRAEGLVVHRDRPGDGRNAHHRRARSSAYTLSDRGTFLATDNLDLDLLVEGGKDLLNPYHVIVVKAEDVNSSLRAGVLGLDRLSEDPT